MKDSKKNRLSRSMFNLYENNTSFNENKMVKNSNERSMMNLYLKGE
jgi:hypothetical protein